MKHEIVNAIQSYVATYQENFDTETNWQTPLVGFASAADPLFNKLKSAVSPTHAMPKDLLEDAHTVIAFFIPFDKKISKSNVKGRMSSRLWAHAYLDTNQLIKDLNLFLKNWLNKRCYESAVLPPTHNFDPKVLISDWSHRHVAYIAGLGTFGLNNMLITEKGCCGRLGSTITNLHIAPDQRPGYDFCLFKHNGTCKKCVERCVNGSLQLESYDRFKCYEICMENDRFYSNLDTTDICGKCLVGVPCSFINPVKPVL